MVAVYLSCWKNKNIFSLKSTKYHWFKKRAFKLTISRLWTCRKCVKSGLELMEKYTYIAFIEILEFYDNLLLLSIQLNVWAQIESRKTRHLWSWLDHTCWQCTSTDWTLRTLKLILASLKFFVLYCSKTYGWKFASWFCFLTWNGKKYYLCDKKIMNILYIKNIYFFEDELYFR